MTIKKARKRRKSVPADEADVDPGPIFERLEQEPMMVVEGGKRKRVTVLEALVLRQFAAAMKGDAKAVRRIIIWVDAYLRLPEDTFNFVVGPDGFDERTQS